MRRTWSEIVSSQAARIVTIVLLILQLGGCVIDSITHQTVIGSVFCLGIGHNALFEWTAAIIWLVVSFSWLIGLASLPLVRLRPVYWGLLLAAPLFFVGQGLLVQRQVLTCDAP